MLVMDAITVRAASNEDAPDISDLTSQLGCQSSIQESSRRLASISGSRNHAVFVACIGDSVIGWIHVFHALRLGSDHFAEIGGLVVSNEYRRRGVGKRLLSSAEEWAIVQGVSKIRVRSSFSRLEAHSFYKQLGFSAVKQQQVVDKPINGTE